MRIWRECVQLKIYSRPKLLKMWRGTEIEVDETKELNQCREKGRYNPVVHVDGKRPNFQKN